MLDYEDLIRAQASPEVEEDVTLHAWVKTHKYLGCIGVCALGTLVIAILLSPAIIYTTLLDGQYVYQISTSECDMSFYTGDFPATTKDYYFETEGMTSIAEHTHWYLGPWRAYPYRRGICPINAATTDQAYLDLFGSEAPKSGPTKIFLTDHYCLRLGTESELPSNLVKVFQNMDNQIVPRGTETMEDAIKGLKRIGTYLIVACWVSWIGIALNFVLFPTINYHFGTLIFLNILTWWLPGVFSLNEILFGAFNSSRNWDSMFPGCNVQANATYTPGVWLLYWQVVSLGIWLFWVSFYAFYVMCYRSWSNSDEDGVDESMFTSENSKYLFREVPTHNGKIEVKWFKCDFDHNYERSFGLPASYIKAKIKPCKYGTASQMKANEYSVSELKLAGFSALELKEAGFNVSGLKEAFAVSELKDAGFSESELKSDKFDALEVENSRTPHFVWGDVHCIYCNNTNIDDQRDYAYFAYCPTCMEAQTNPAGQLVESLQHAESGPVNLRHYSVCMQCAIRWKDGITLQVSKSRSVELRELTHSNLTAAGNMGLMRTASSSHVNWARELSDSE
jgi:hypothetical protein